jgi:hypothetical protein
MSGGLVDLPENVRALLPHSQKMTLQESANGSMSSRSRTVEDDDNNNSDATVDEDFKLHNLSGGDSVGNILQERGNLHTEPMKKAGLKTGFPLLRPKKLLSRLFPGLLAPDYSKKPMKLGSLPGKRTNPYSIP